MEERDQIHRLIASTGALYEGGHYRYSSGLHGSIYVEKDRVLAAVDVSSKLCYRIAKHYFAEKIQVVTGPSMGGAMMAPFVAYYLEPKAIAVYAEGERENRYFRPSVVDMIAGKRVLVVEDVLDTGGSALRVIEAVERQGGEVVGVASIWNRGNVTFRYPLFCLVEHETYEPGDCPICKEGRLPLEAISNGR
ncbi:MAG: phosphoribosyltransferase family protein [Sphingomonadaceae bacterium]